MYMLFVILPPSIGNRCNVEYFKNPKEVTRPIVIFRKLSFLLVRCAFLFYGHLKINDIRFDLSRMKCNRCD